MIAKKEDRVRCLSISQRCNCEQSRIYSQEPKVVKPSENICEKDLESAVRMIKGAEKPYIFVGGGAVLSGASKELYEFVKKVDAPVTDSLMGKGAFPGTDPLYTGMLGMHGTKTSNLESVNVIF